MRRFNGTAEEIKQCSADLIEIADVIKQFTSGETHEIADELIELAKLIEQQATNLEKLEIEE